MYAYILTKNNCRYWLNRIYKWKEVSLERSYSCESACFLSSILTVVCLSHLHAKNFAIVHRSITVHFPTIPWYIIMTNTIVRSTFRSDTSVNSRFVRPGQIPSLSRRDGVKFLTIRISRAPRREWEIVFHFTYTGSSYDGNQHVDRGNAVAAAAARRKDIPQAPLVGLIERVPSQPYFRPSSHEVVNPWSPGRTSVNIDVNLEERNGWTRVRERAREEITQGPRETRRGETNLIHGGSDGN